MSFSCVRQIQTAKCDIYTQLALYSTSEFSCIAGWEGLEKIALLPPVVHIKRCPKRKLFCVVVMFYVAIRGKRRNKTFGLIRKGVIIRGIYRNKRQKSGRRKEIADVKVATLSCPAHSHFNLFLHLKKHLTGQKIHEDERVKKTESLRRCGRWRRSSVSSEYENRYPGQRNAFIKVVTVLKN